MKLKGVVTMHYTQAQAFQRLLVAAQRMTRGWKEFEYLVELGDSQAVELRAALDALQSRPLNTQPEDA